MIFHEWSFHMKFIIKPSLRRPRNEMTIYVLSYDLKYAFIASIMGIFSMKIYIDVTNAVNDIMYYMTLSTGKQQRHMMKYFKHFSMLCRDPEWGIRDIKDLKKLAEENGIKLTRMVRFLLYVMSRCMRKPTLWCSDQVRHKPGCTVTLDG